MNVHELKVWPQYFDALISGNKTFEVRKDDRRFRAGDAIELREWDPVTRDYTGRSTFRIVGYVLSAADEIGAQALQPGYVVLSLKAVE